MHQARNHEGAAAGEQDGVAIGVRLGDKVIAQDTARAAAILNHDGLTEACGHALGQDAPHDVVAAAGGEGNDQPQGARREALCKGNRGRGQKGEGRAAWRYLRFSCAFRSKARPR